MDSLRTNFLETIEIVPFITMTLNALLRLYQVWKEMPISGTSVLRTMLLTGVDQLLHLITQLLIYLLRSG